jgi:hypothetical protein
MISCAMMIFPEKDCLMHLEIVPDRRYSRENNHRRPTGEAMILPDEWDWHTKKRTA